MMAISDRAPAAFRFGEFELDAHGTELRHRGVSVRLQPQPLQVLLVLVCECGRIVPRDELRQRLWKDDTFVGFEDGVNHAISKLREVLGDSVQNPRFIETIPRQGYKFIATVEAVGPPSDGPSLRTEIPRRTTDPLLVRVWARPYLLLSIFAIGLLLGALIWRYAISFSSRPITSIAVLTFATFSSMEEDVALADALTARLIGRLSKQPRLQVVPLAEVRKYAGNGKTLSQIGRELNVGAVIEGSVQRQGDHVRVALKIIRTSDEQHICALVYEGDSKDLQVIEEQLAAEVSSEVQAPSAH